jgi:hypothetical protein
MRKSVVVFMFMLLFCALGMAQVEPQLFEVPKNEISFGYSYQRAQVIGSPVPSVSAGLSGISIDFSHYLSHVLHGNAGIMLEISHVSNSSFDVEGDGFSRSSYMGGPTYRLHRYGFFSPAVHVLAGVDHATITVQTIPTTLSFTDTDFAIAGGGTVDGNLSKHLAIRLARVDYLYTHHFGTGQSSFRYIGGIVLRF